MKKAKIVSLISILFFTLGLFIKPQLALAGSYWDMQIGMDSIGLAYGEDPDSVKDVRFQIVKIINVVLTILGLLVVVLIIFAGFQWMIAGGSEEKVTKAKSILKNAVIGLIIIMMAWSVTYWTMRRLQAINEGNDFYLEPI